MKYLFYSAIAFLLVACSTHKNIDHKSDLKSISEIKLVNSVRDHQFNFENFYAKKIDVDFDVPGMAMSVKGSMYLKRDSQIVVSIAPMLGIELARAMLTPNEIVIIDRTKKRVYHSNYESLSKKINVNVNFYLLQSVLINKLKCSLADEDCMKSFDHGISNYHYYLQNFKERSLTRRMRQKYDGELLYQYFFEPENFQLVNLKISNFSSGDMLSAEYKDFKKFSGNLFPCTIDMNGTSKGSVAKVKLSFLQIEFDSSNEIGFKIPDKYETIDIK